MTIHDLSVELVARIFEELEVEDAWSARGVCRYWHSVFEYVAYGAACGIYLKGVQVSVDVVCAIVSAKGEFLDRHIVHGNLAFDPSKGSRSNTTMTVLVPQERKYEFWPGGKWRKYTISDVLKDVKLQFSNFPSFDQDLVLGLGADVALARTVTRRQNKSVHFDEGYGKFKDFVVSIDTLDDRSCCGKSYDKHCITSLVAPKWQIYALLVQHSRLQRVMMEDYRRHFIESGPSLDSSIDVEATENVYMKSAEDGVVVPIRYFNGHLLET
jgi:hypothetical protein